MPTLSFSLIVVALGTTPAGNETVDFIGFSKNNALAAYRLLVEAPQPGGTTDRYGLVVVMLMPEHGVGGETVTTFRDAEPKRFNAGGRHLRTAPRHLLEANPRFAQARPRSEWLALKRRARFKGRRLPLGDSTLRLAPFEGVELESHRGKQAIDMTAAPQGAVGFDTVLRKWSGELVSGGTFEMECPEDGQLEARLEAFHSPDGYSLAVVTTFSIHTADGVREVPRVAFSRMLHSPVATTQIGTWRIANENMRWGTDWYNLKHPGMEHHYEKFVGDKVTLRADATP